jgi:hypothetical protein
MPNKLERDVGASYQKALKHGKMISRINSLPAKKKISGPKTLKKLERAFEKLPPNSELSKWGREKLAKKKG